MKRTLALAAFLLSSIPNVFAVEGGTGHYLLGSRDLGAGFVPPPGIYQTNDFALLHAAIPSAVSIGGIVVTNPKLDVFLYKPSVTYVPNATLNGKRIGINIALPIASTQMDFTGVLGGVLAGNLSDSQKGVGDLVISPMIGSDHGNFHFNFAATMFLPTGQYSTASVDIPSRSVDVLSIGKNYFSFDPTLGVTYFNPATGFEASGALGVTFSTKNEATDYQTAPELHFEGVLAAHLHDGIVVGATGYGYYQLAEDSGAGAESFKALTGTTKLQAYTFGAGPIVAWNTKIGDVGLSMKAKYVYEFATRRRFSSHGAFGTVGFAF